MSGSSQPAEYTPTAEEIFEVAVFGARMLGGAALDETEFRAQFDRFVESVKTHAAPEAGASSHFMAVTEDYDCTVTHGVYVSYVAARDDVERMIREDQEAKYATHHADRAEIHEWSGDTHLRTWRRVGLRWDLDWERVTPPPQKVQ